MKRIRLSLWRAVGAIACALALTSCQSLPGEPMEFAAEAESGALQGVRIASEGSGFTGPGYVTGFDAEGDRVTFEFMMEEEGLYEMGIGYRSPNGEKATRLSLNGAPFGDVTLPATDVFAEVDAGKVLLREGRNRIALDSFWGWYDIDKVTIRRASPRPEHQVKNELANPNASPEALALHRYLVEGYGKRILAGQQTLKDALQLNWEYGKLPAVAGFDLIEYSPSRVEHGAVSREIEDMLQWHELGGIAALAWHWNAPTDLIDSAEQPWWKGFYTEGTTFDVEKALSNPNSEAYRLLLRDIDAIAAQIQRLEDEHIPVLWRPLHEAEGGWFWWGAKGPEPAKRLWRLLYDRLTNAHGLDNLIWVWNSESPEWYPGDDVVDIVSVDSYPQPGDYSPVNGRYERLVELVNDRKLVALTENGPIPDPDLLMAYDTRWSWFCTWSGEFIRDGVQNSKEHIRNVLEHEYVVTLDELPGLYNAE